MDKACRAIGLGFFQVQMIVAKRFGNDEQPEGETASSVTTKGTQGALVRKKEWTLKHQENGWIGRKLDQGRNRRAACWNTPIASRWTRRSTPAIAAGPLFNLDGHPAYHVAANLFIPLPCAIPAQVLPHEMAAFVPVADLLPCQSAVPGSSSSEEMWKEASG